jgi:hypothetical protein
MHRVTRHLRIVIQHILKINVPCQFSRNAADILDDQHSQPVLPIDQPRRVMVRELQELNHVAVCLWCDFESAKVFMQFA